jgi:hypothetical protein
VQKDPTKNCSPGQAILLQVKLEFAMLYPEPQRRHFVLAVALMWQAIQLAIPHVPINTHLLSTRMYPSTQEVQMADVDWQV